MKPQPELQLDEAARKIAEALDGGVEEREAQYASLEGAMRAAPPSGSGRDAVAALAVAHVKPLIASVLCADASKVGVEEFRRASLLFGEMAEFDPFGVCGEMHCKDAPNIFDVWTAPGQRAGVGARAGPERVGSGGGVHAGIQPFRLGAVLCAGSRGHAGARRDGGNGMVRHLGADHAHRQPIR